MFKLHHHPWLHEFHRQWRKIRELPTFEERMTALSVWLQKLEQRAHHLKTSLHHYVHQFYVTYAALHDRPYELDTDHPVVIEEDMQTARKSRRFIRALIALEVIVTALILVLRYHLSVPVSIVVGLGVGLLTSLAGEAIVSVMKHLKQPQTTLRRLMHWIGAPSAVILVISLVVLAFAWRASDVSTIILFHRIFNIALWTAGISLMVLVGVLCNHEHIMRWSHHLHQRHATAREELIDTEAEIRHVEQETGELRAALENAKHHGNHGREGDRVPVHSPNHSHIRKVVPDRVNPGTGKGAGHE